MTKHLRSLVLVMTLALLAAACGGDDTSDTATTAPPEAASTETGTSSEMMTEGTSTEMATETGSEAAMASSAACTAEDVTEVIETGPEEGTLEGMSDDPVATAAANSPVLTTLATAVREADLVDTLNEGEALTVFAPTDCAFANLDQATLEAALADPEGLLTDLLGFHVIPGGEMILAADLEDGQELETLSGETLLVNIDGDTVTVGDGQAEVIVPDIETANATVHLIDAVLLPPSAQ